MPDKTEEKNMTVHATQWHKHGDHPDVTPYTDHAPPGMESDGNAECPMCTATVREHGWLPYKDDGFIVCRGGWIVEIVRYADVRVKAPKSKFYCHDEMFKVLRDAWNTFIITHNEPQPNPEPETKPVSNSTIEI